VNPRRAVPSNALKDGLTLSVVLTTVLLLGACGGGSRSDESDAGGPLPGPGASVRTVVVTDSLDQPTDVVAAPDGALWVTERTGLVRAVDPGRGVVADRPVLDLTDQVLADGGEQGLLGLAVAPDGSSLVVDFVAPGGQNGVTTVLSIPLSGGRADLDGATTLLSVDQPFANHNGGGVRFGPDGMLYVGLGDGGDQGDPQGNGQSLNTPLAKILRIDPTDGSAPDDNPFAGAGAAAGADPRTWHSGLRNPWRFSFDARGALWIGDVGGSEREELNRVDPGVSGANFGWQVREGTLATGTRGSADGFVGPIAEFDHEDGWCSIIGGVVVPDDAPVLGGAYVFGDNCQSTLWAIPNALEVGTAATASPLADADVSSLTSISVIDSTVYVLTLDGEIRRVVAR